MKVHMVTDIHTGSSMIRGRSGRMYTTAEYERARNQHDPESLAMRADMDRSDMSDADMRELMRQELHDCPECRAAMARGEQPQFFSGADLMAQISPRERARLARRIKAPKRRWREQRRG